MAVARLADAAKDDLQQISADYARKSAAAARTMLTQLRQAMRRHARFPGMGRARPELRPNLRSFVVRPFVVFFEPSTNGIKVLRVLHGSRNIDAIMATDDPD